MQHYCFKCKNSFDRNFTPNKLKVCKFCGWPVVPQGKRKEAIKTALNIMTGLINEKGKHDVWNMIEEVSEPFKRTVFRDYYITALKRIEKSR